MENRQIDRVILGIDPGTNILGYGILNVSGTKSHVEALGVIDLRKCRDVYMKLGRIYERINSLIESFHPNEMAIEAPFFGKNAQSMLKLGRAQGVAIASAINNGIPIYEYAPLKIKMAITGNGKASKEQVAGMLKRILGIDENSMVPFLDATDALGVAYCHFLEYNKPVKSKGEKWKDFIQKNPSRIIK